MSNYVYICSAGHSGSTLLDLLLGSHSRIESLGEISHLPKNIALNTDCSCGAKLTHCNVWKPILISIGEKLNADLFVTPYALNTGYPKAVTVVDRSHQTPYYLLERKFVHGLMYLELKHGLTLLKSTKKKFYQSLDHRFLLYDSVKEHQKVGVVVDSSKTYLEAIALYRMRPQQVKIILLTRDGRGVMYSNMKKNLGRRHGLVGWKHYYSRALPLLEKHVKQEDFITVHYEDLAERTNDELERLCQFLSLDFEPSMRDFSAHEHHITNGNDMRFSRSSEIRLDNSWKTGLTKKDLQFFDRLAGKLSRSLGYP